MIVGYTVPEIWCVTNVIVIFSFRLFFALLPPYSPKSKISKKFQKQMETSSFYTSAPKTMIICYTVFEIWHMMYVIFIFHFELFFALLPL